MRCSSDLRLRVIEFVNAGGRKAEAARRFRVGQASVYRWLSANHPTAYRKPGPRRARKLDRAALVLNVARHEDWTQAERARHFGVSRFCIWHNLHRLKVSRKKNDPLLAGRSTAKKAVSAPAGALRKTRKKTHSSG